MCPENTITCRHSRSVTLLLVSLLTTCALSGQTHRELANPGQVPVAKPATPERTPQNLVRWHMGATLILVKDDQFQHIQAPDIGYFE